MHHDVVRRIQSLSLKFVGDDRHRPVRFISHHAAAAVLAGELASFEIERVAVAVAGRIAEDGDAAVFFDPAHLDVVRDIAPHQVTADSVPGGTFGPQRAEMKPPDDRIVHDVTSEAVIQGDDVRIGILNGLLPVPVTDRRR